MVGSLTRSVGSADGGSLVLTGSVNSVGCRFAGCFSLSEQLQVV